MELCASADEVRDAMLAVGDVPAELALPVGAPLPPDTERMDGHSVMVVPINASVTLFSCAHWVQLCRSSWCDDTVWLGMRKEQEKVGLRSISTWEVCRAETAVEFTDSTKPGP